MPYIHSIINQLFFAHFWFPTVHDVLHADWHDAWQFPHPPFKFIPEPFTILIWAIQSSELIN